MISRFRVAGIAAATAGLLAAAWTAFYLWILWREGEGDLAEASVRFLATSVGAAAVLLVLATHLSSGKARATALAACATALTCYALLAALSIGILLMPAAALAWLAFSREHATSWEALLGAVLGAVFPLGFLLLI
jgi:hypothetical protein